MNFRRISLCVLFSSAVAGFIPASASCIHDTDTGQQQKVNKTRPMAGKPGGPQLGSPGGGPVIDKTGDPILQAMITAELPQFIQHEFTDTVTGKTLSYSLFTPQSSDSAGRYPLVLFMADASTPGTDVTRPLTQGYGALVWATQEWQAQHPCFVLVPQFSGVAVNDAYEHTDEVDMVMRLLQKISTDPLVDSSRLYTTGQSMGGMISMYFNAAYPDVFAGSVFVDCHWDSATFDELVKHPFAFITAGKAGTFGALEAAADKAGVKYEYAEWSAKLPQETQDSLAAAELAKGAPINIINFESKTVLPDDGKGSEHMYSFDYAYRLTPVRKWLFTLKKEASLLTDR